MEVLTGSCVTIPCSFDTDSDSVSAGGGGGNLGEFDVLCSSSLSVSSANADMDRPSGSKCGDIAGESGPHESSPCGTFETFMPFEAFMPQTMEVLTGSSLTIPCSFDVPASHESDLDDTCRAIWINDQKIVFNSRYPQSTTNNGELRGDLTKKDCTTTLNNMQPAHSNNYTFMIHPKTPQCQCVPLAQFQRDIA
ncbi:Sialoadhesin [Liparis tanakae]|uniref:Sialoadhesin n=1 Tax=Liparis tanakae TaxID=230148 RepID=A0A4Z2E9Q2_9TELE|nr:Sialoadhesin [Liparis tanakae]